MFESLSVTNLKALKLQLLNMIGIQEEDLTIENLNKLLEIIPIEYYTYLIKLLKMDKLLGNETVKLIYDKIHESAMNETDEVKAKDTVDNLMAIRTLLYCVGKEKDLNKAIKEYSSYIKGNKDEERLTPLFNTVAGILILCKSILFDK